MAPTQPDTPNRKPGRRGPINMAAWSSTPVRNIFIIPAPYISSPRNRLGLLRSDPHSFRGSVEGHSTGLGRRSF